MIRTFFFFIFQIDFAIEEIVQALPKITESVLTEEILQYTALNFIRKVMDAAKHKVMLEYEVKQSSVVGYCCLSSHSSIYRQVGSESG
jgi:hypothetical protein